MYTLTNNQPEEMAEKQRIAPYIEASLVSYYDSLIKEKPGHEFRYKNQLSNALLEFYFTNKNKFQLAPLELYKSFMTETKEMFSLRLSETNEQLMEFFCVSTKRVLRPASEFIITSVLMVMKEKKIDEIYYTPEDGLKFYKNNRIYKF